MIKLRGRCRKCNNSVEDYRVDASEPRSPPKYLFIGVAWIANNSWGGPNNAHDLSSSPIHLIKPFALEAPRKIHIFYNDVWTVGRWETLVMIISPGIFSFSTKSGYSLSGS